MAWRRIDKQRACILQTADVPVRPSRKDRVVSRRRVGRVKRTCIPECVCGADRLSEILASHRYGELRSKESRLLAESRRRELIQPRLHEIKIQSGDRCGK